MFNKKKKNTHRQLKDEYDAILLRQVNEARVNYQQAQESEVALIDSRVNGHLIQAQTAMEKAKFSYLYNEARRRKTVAKNPLLFHQPQD
ncbi:DUF2508 family protein [Fructobacillus ficulneus]|uniref:DUF2508 family protein n=1 Tax=Fructobacillus ficulneus TaxID=157463 RepID=A0A0K8MF80_9LACO|nr:DUF2508 family protein [Fructobacillus ficulneus]GAO99196.1 hypothetical protein FFIC_090180 [Fructobacillus ficulneus]